MKKFLVILLALATILSLAGCGSKKPELEGVAKIVDEAKNMSIDELIAKAKEETGDFIVYSTSSKSDKAVKAFQEKYGLEGDFSASTQHEKDFYSTIEELVDADNKSADFMVTQNAISVGQEIKAGRFINYIPVVEGAASSSAYAFMLYTKEFTINKKFTAEANLTNVWDLTDDTFTGNIIWKKEGEPVNELMMMEMTTDKWAKALQEAYDAKYGAGECKKAMEAEGVKTAGHLWIKRFMPKTTNVAGEGDMAKAIVASTTPSVGFGVVSKYKTSGDPSIDEVDRLYLDGFKGFMYQFYAQISKSTDRPYTAMLFANYLASAEGSANYGVGKDIAIYSTTSTVTKDLAQLKEGYIIEDLDAIRDIYAEMIEFIEKARQS